MSEAAEAPSLITGARGLAPLLGFGLFAASLPFLPPQLSYVGGLLFSEGKSSMAAIGAFAAIIAGIVSGLTALRQPANRRRLPEIVPMLCFIGYPFAIAALFVSSALGGAAASIGGGLSSAIASCLAIPFAIAWLNILTDLPLRQAAQSLCVSIALASGLNILAVAHLLPYSPLFGVALAAVSAIGPLCSRSTRKCAEKQDARRNASAPVATASVSSSDLLTRSMLPTVVAMCFGLFLAVFSMTGRICAYVQNLMPALYFNIDAASPFAAAIVLFAFFQIRKRMNLAEIAYFYIPLCSVFFFVASTFAAESPLFNLGFAGSTVLLMTIGLLALEALPGVVQAGEIPPRLICAIVITGCALASFFGIELPSAIPVQELGPFLLLVATVYFVVIISIALVHQKRLASELEEPEFSHEASAHINSRDSVLQHIESTFGLTERECEVLGYVAAGHNSPYIAERLFISEYTVRTHMRNIYRKTGVESKEGLVRFIESYEAH